MMGELRSLAMISGGMVLGSMGGKAIDNMLKVDETIPGFQTKKLVRPMALLGAGVLGSSAINELNLHLYTYFNTVTAPLDVFKPYVRV